MVTVQPSYSTIPYQVNRYMDIVESGEVSMWTTGASNLGCRLITVVQWALWLPNPAREDKGASFSYSVEQPFA